MLSVFVLVAAACGDSEGGSGGTRPVTTGPVATSPVTTSPVGSDIHALAGTAWVALAISDGGDGTAIPVGAEPTIDFSAGGRTISGSTACNSYSGEVVIGAGTISVGAMSVTERACADSAIMDLEARFIEVLTNAQTFQLADRVLDISGRRGSVLLRAPAPVSDAPLDGTDWVLDTLIDGEAASSVITTTLPFLKVDGDAIRGSTGCNDLRGDIATDAGTITLSNLSWTEIGCDSSVMRQESVILEVLTNADRFTIEGERLTIFSTGDQALVYRAG